MAFPDSTSVSSISNLHEESTGRKAVEPSFVNQGVLCVFFGQTAVYSSE
ncbi:hypothetical protein MDA_GLEAN10009042 [Myotis davidii]|uniref:Uncharacterized protein n=1 Tax=Myotis davidii TaxID=225400 RepID=L5MHM5_MYODS|nr:hypothetical protein MDA_GLEAN10009042 [Myotis davidii]